MPKKVVQFHKMVASGNDFIVVDNRKKPIRLTKEMIKKLCARHTGIGADGVLLVEKSKRANFKMRIINSDGSEAEACGNGFRCIALYGRKVMGMPGRFKFDSIAGVIQAKLQARNISVGLSKPFGLKENNMIEVLGHRLGYSFINTGVPHVVVHVDNIEKVEVERLGRAIRKHAYFKPKGTNVNFVQVKGKSRVLVRTYERGVEEETLACGTGSTASAIISVLAGFTKSPVSVKTRSGETLKISFQKKGKQIRNVTLEGQARFVYEGSFNVS